MALVATPPIPVASPPPQPSPHYRVAGFWRRLLAGLIDCLLLAPVLGLLGTGFALLLNRLMPRTGDVDPYQMISTLTNGSAVGEALLFLCLSLFLLYFFLFHCIRGQTPGKRLLGMVVIDIYGERPGLARTLLRTTGYVISALLFSLGFLWIGFDRERRGLHDWLAGTYVVLAR